MAKTAHSLHLYDLTVQDVFGEQCICSNQSCLLSGFELTVGRPFIPPVGFPRVPGIIGLPK
jgi:hypothetical protein